MEDPQPRTGSLASPRKPKPPSTTTSGVSSGPTTTGVTTPSLGIVAGSTGVPSALQSLTSPPATASATPLGAFSMTAIQGATVGMGAPVGSMTGMMPSPSAGMISAGGLNPDLLAQFSDSMSDLMTATGPASMRGAANAGALASLGFNVSDPFLLATLASTSDPSRELSLGIGRDSSIGSNPGAPYYHLPTPTGVKGAAVKAGDLGGSAGASLVPQTPRIAGPKGLTPATSDGSAIGGLGSPMKRMQSDSLSGTNFFFVPTTQQYSSPQELGGARGSLSKSVSTGTNEGLSAGGPTKPPATSGVGSATGAGGAGAEGSKGATGAAGAGSSSSTTAGSKGMTSAGVASVSKIAGVGTAGAGMMTGSSLAFQASPPESALSPGFSAYGGGMMSALPSAMMSVSQMAPDGTVFTHDPSLYYSSMTEAGGMLPMSAAGQSPDLYGSGMWAPYGGFQQFHSPFPGSTPMGTTTDFWASPSSGIGGAMDPTARMVGAHAGGGGLPDGMLPPHSAMQHRFMGSRTGIMSGRPDTMAGEMHGGEYAGMYGSRGGPSAGMVDPRRLSDGSMGSGMAGEMYDGGAAGGSAAARRDEAFRQYEYYDDSHITGGRAGGPGPAGGGSSGGRGSGGTGGGRDRFGSDDPRRGALGSSSSTGGAGGTPGSGSAGRTGRKQQSRTGSGRGRSIRSLMTDPGNNGGMNVDGIVGSSRHRGYYASLVLRERLRRDIDTRSLPRSGVTLLELCDLKLIEILARDQHGSRYIQHCLESATEEEKSKCFDQVFEHTLSLCEDVFGNYVIQKLFEHGNEKTVMELARMLRGRVLPLTKSMYGCRVIQKALECIDIPLRSILVLELKGHVEDCVRDQNGNHVIQKAIEEVPTDQIQFIVDAFLKRKTIVTSVVGIHHPTPVSTESSGETKAGSSTIGPSKPPKSSQTVVAVVEFASHPYGCRVIQRLLEKCTDKQKQPILDEILRESINLSRDQYGNYVVQHILQFGTVKARRDILRICADNVVSLSKHKFSSNVIEKCFIYTTDSERDELIGAVIGTRPRTDLPPQAEDATKEDIGSPTHPPLIPMVKDQYGNYVIQKILEVSTHEQFERLVKKIIEFVPNLRRLMFGKHIIAKIEQLSDGRMTVADFSGPDLLTDEDTARTAGSMESSKADHSDSRPETGAKSTSTSGSSSKSGGLAALASNIGTSALQYRKRIITPSTGRGSRRFSDRPPLPVAGTGSRR